VSSLVASPIAVRPGSSRRNLRQNQAREDSAQGDRVDESLRIPHSGGWLNCTSRSFVIVRGPSSVSRCFERPFGLQFQTFFSPFQIPIYGIRARQSGKEIINQEKKPNAQYTEKRKPNVWLQQDHDSILFTLTPHLSLLQSSINPFFLGKQ